MSTPFYKVFPWWLNLLFVFGLSFFIYIIIVVACFIWLSTQGIYVGDSTPLLEGFSMIQSLSLRLFALVFGVLFSLVLAACTTVGVVQRSQAKSSTTAPEGTTPAVAQVVAVQWVAPYLDRALPLAAQLEALLQHKPHQKPFSYPNNLGGTHAKPYYLLTEYMNRAYRQPFEGKYLLASSRRDGADFFYNGFEHGLTYFNKKHYNIIPLFVTSNPWFAPPAEAQADYPLRLNAQGKRIFYFPFYRDGATQAEKDEIDKKVGDFKRFDVLDNEINKNLDVVVASTYADPKTGKPMLFDTSNNYPIYYHFGGASVGFLSLEQALIYLNNHPKEVVWLLSTDNAKWTPTHVAGEDPNEGATVVFLAHKDFDTGREPLAWVHPVARIADEQTKNQTKQSTPGNSSERIQAAISQSLANAKLKPTDIARVFHDSGRDSKRLGNVAHAVSRQLPDLDWLSQSRDIVAWLGDQGSLTVSQHLILATWAAHQEGKGQLILSTSDANRTFAAVVTPPGVAYTKLPKNTKFYTAAAEPQCHRFWWGARKDGKFDYASKPDGMPARPYKLLTKPWTYRDNLAGGVSID